MKKCLKICQVFIVLLFIVACNNKKDSENTNLKQESAFNNAFEEFQWSHPNEEESVYWRKAKDYCADLKEGGYSDWRQPDIDELRTLVKNHSGTQTGGSCKISKKAKKLSSIDWTDDCKGKDDGNHSKLDFVGCFVSSSGVSDDSTSNWEVCLHNGALMSRDEGMTYPLCVRDTTKKSTQPKKNEQNHHLSHAATTTNDKIIIDSHNNRHELEWSKVSDNTMTYAGAENYCRNLIENDHDDWRIPNIDELKTISFCPKTTSDKCKVGEKEKCLAISCGGSSIKLEDFVKNNNCICISEEDQEKAAKKFEKQFVELIKKFKLTQETVERGMKDLSSLSFEERDNFQKLMVPMKELLKTQASFLWSSSSVYDVPAGKWVFTTLGISIEEENHDLNVKCVRNVGRGTKDSQKKSAKPRKIGDLLWSNKAPNKMNWGNAVNYCENLNEDGSRDWRLPNIDELRTLIKNCSKTETGGECKVSAKNNCLSNDCWQPAGSCYCKNQSNSNDSKLDNSEYYWSSSVRSDNSQDAWALHYFYFSNGNLYKDLVDIENKSHLYKVRCVR